MQALRHPQSNMIALSSSIQPLDSELSAAKMHRASVRSRLEKAFAVSAVQNIGSHCRGTAIRRYSDLDVMVVHHRETQGVLLRVLSSQNTTSRNNPLEMYAARPQMVKIVAPLNIRCTYAHADRYEAAQKVLSKELGGERV